jgi:hypothetical protein
MFMIVRSPCRPAPLRRRTIERPLLTLRVAVARRRIQTAGQRMKATHRIRSIAISCSAGIDLRFRSHMHGTVHLLKLNGTKKIPPIV